MRLTESRFSKIIITSISVFFLFVFITKNYKSKPTENRAKHQTDYHGNFRSVDPLYLQYIQTHQSIFYTQKYSRNELESIYGTCENIWSQKASQAEVNASIGVQTHVLGSLRRGFQKCENFFSRRIHLYNTEPVNKFEESFPIAYTLLVYHEFDQVEQILMSIFRRQNVYCINVDNSTAKPFKELVSRLARCFPDNIIIPKRVIDVHYARVTQTRAELNCMMELLAFSDKWKYLINLTGEELPLLTNLEIVTVLHKMKGSNVIDGPLHFDDHLRYPTERLPFGLQKFKSQTHFVFSREATQFINDNPNITETFLSLIMDFKYPEESFFALLQFNHHLNMPGALKERWSEESLPFIPYEHESHGYFNRYKMWFFQKNFTCLSGKKQRHICMIGVKTLPELINKSYGKQMFINKFPWRFEPRAWDCILSWNYKKVQLEYETRKPALAHYAYLDNPQLQLTRKNEKR